MRLIEKNNYASIPKQTDSLFKVALPSMVTFTPIYSYCRKKNPKPTDQKGIDNPPFPPLDFYYIGFLLYLF